MNNKYFEAAGNSLRYTLPLCLGAVMMFFIRLLPPSNLSETEQLTAGILFSLLYIGVTALFSFNKKCDLTTVLFISAALAALVYLRVCLLGYRSPDYNSFLFPWTEEMRELTVKEVLTKKIGDYNMPYLYFLLFVSRVGSPLVWIKWFSCIFDFVAAFFLMKCISLTGKSEVACNLSFLLTAALPTVFVNSAYWAQCDSVVSAFCIGSLYFALRGKGIQSAAMFAIAFSFKLQAIFILPALIAFFFIKKLKPLHALIFPAVFFITLLPAILAGRGFLDSVRIYYDQAGQYPQLTLNAPTLWQFFEGVGFDFFRNVGIMLAGLAAVVLLYIAFRYRENLNTELLVLLCFISALMIPFLLPRMHERYFYLADLLSVAVFFYDRRKWYVPLVTVAASFNGYFAFLENNEIFSQTTAATALLILLIILIKEFTERITAYESDGKAA